MHHRDFNHPIFCHYLLSFFQDDWRARVRGLERVASALRTSSALIAIESRLGSLLHAVLGGERSCRVAAAGFAVAKVSSRNFRQDQPLNARRSRLIYCRNCQRISEPCYYVIYISRVIEEKYPIKKNLARISIFFNILRVFKIFLKLAQKLLNYFF